MDLLTNLRIDQEIIIFVLKLLTISLLSFSVQIFLNFLKFEWVKSTNQVFNFLLLGPIGFAITSVISSNIALSLGMVGALSIIRFRTPVKNSFELVIYFLLLTIGITASVSIEISVMLTLFVNFILIFVKVVLIFKPQSTLLNENHNTEFRNFLTVTSKEELNLENLNLVSLEFENGSYKYVLSSNKSEIIKFQDNLIKTKNESIEKITTNFYN